MAAEPITDDTRVDDMERRLRLKLESVRPVPTNHPMV